MRRGRGRCRGDTCATLVAYEKPTTYERPHAPKTLPQRVCEAFRQPPELLVVRYECPILQLVAR